MNRVMHSLTVTQFTLPTWYERPEGRAVLSLNPVDQSGHAETIQFCYCEFPSAVVAVVLDDLFVISHCPPAHFLHSISLVSCSWLIWKCGRVGRSCGEPAILGICQDEVSCPWFAFGPLLCHFGCHGTESSLRQSVKKYEQEHFM